MKSLHDNVFALFLTGVTLFGLITPTPAGPIRLVRTKVVGSQDNPFVLVNISTGNDATQSDDPNGISLWIRRPTGEAGPPFVRNKVGTVAALNIRPATKWEMVYLLLSFERGKVIVLSDFNERLTKLCEHSHKKINSRRVSVERIDGKMLTVTSSDYGVANYSLKVSVTPGGRLRLLRYKKNAIQADHP